MTAQRRADDLVGDDEVLADVEADKRAIMAVIEAETDAWMRRDFDALAEHWLHSPETRRMTSFASLGIDVDEGWDAVATRVRGLMGRLPLTYRAERLTRQRVNIVVGLDMAWVSYDQVGEIKGDNFELAGVRRELKIFHRVAGVWKIACLVILQSSVELVDYPLIEIDAEMRVLWLNHLARDRIKGHAGLAIAGNRLRALHPPHQAALREAAEWAVGEAHVHLPPTGTERQSRPVPLGVDDSSVPLFCWVIVNDGKALVSFDNAEMVAKRMASAKAIYGLSPAQVRLATLIAEGKDLTDASDVLGVSVNTLRTHLQRMFERTGVHSQAALIRVLLSAEMPG